MPNFPLPLDQELLFRRLREQERELAKTLAALEEQIQRFEEVERRAYENWSRMEFGPQYADLEKLYEEIRIRQVQAQRIQDLVQSGGMNAREALYKIQSGKSETSDDEIIEARRRAKRETKRADRKQARREQRKDQIASRPISRTAPKQTSLVSLYRVIARKLHPDSPTALKDMVQSRAKNLWHEVQTAYQAGNFERLLAIGVWLEGVSSGEDSPTPSRSHADQLLRLRSLEKSCRTLASKLDELRVHPAWGFTSSGPSLRKKLRKQLGRDIEAEYANAQEIVEALDEFYTNIGPPRAPRSRR